MDEIHIAELREAGSDGGSLMGYYCRGHADRWAFAEACNHYTGAVESYDVRYVKADRVRHVWWRTVPISGDPGHSAYHDAEPGSRGAWQATVADVLYRQEMVQTHRLIAEAEKRHSYGFSDGVNWCLRLLQFQHKDAAKFVMDAWHNGAGPRAAEKSLEDYR